MAYLGKTPADVQLLSIVGRRNLIINGAMQVWQRSTDDTEGGNGWGYRHADRYYTNKGRYRKETDTINGREWDVMHIDDNGVGYNGGRGMIYKHEEYRDYANTLTLSFYAKASSSSVVNIGASNFPAGGTQLISGQNVTLTTDWERYDVQLTASSAPTQTGETYIINDLDDGVDYYITGIQMEVGDIATPFEHRSYGEELALCQRYFETNDVNEFYLLPTASGTQVQRQTINFATPKRVGGTITLTRNATQSTSGTVVGGFLTGVSNFMVYFTGIQYNVVWYDWEADAEL